METLNPSAQFMRVRDKFFSEFILLDPDVKKNASLLYILLFRKGYENGGTCRIPQAVLAGLIGCCVRSIQNYLRLLCALKYVAVETLADGCNAYRLLLSPRAKHFIAQADALAMWDVERAPDHAQNLRVAHANSAPSYKNTKNKGHTPLSPLPAFQPREAVPSGPSSCREPLAPPVAPRSGGNGRGDAFPSDAFERLWSVWPVKKDQAVSRRIFLSLSRARRLPAIDALLATIARFKATDRHWRNGCAPLLSSWLRGERWLDEPYAPQADNTTPSTPAPSPEMAERLRRCAARVTERPADPTLEASRPAFEAMLEHFPDGRRKRGPAWGLWSLLLRNGKTPSAAQVLRNGTMDVLAFLQMCRHQPCRA